MKSRVHRKDVARLARLAGTERHLGRPGRPYTAPGNGFVRSGLRTEYAEALENQGMRHRPLVESARPETRVDRYCDMRGGYRR
jgi:hypothetical protein